MASGSGAAGCKWTNFQANSIPTFAVSAFFCRMPIDQPPSGAPSGGGSPWFGQIQGRIGTARPRLGHKRLASWQSSPPKNPTPALLLPRDNVRPGARHGMFPACYGWPGSMATVRAYYVYAGNRGPRICTNAPNGESRSRFPRIFYVDEI